MLPGVLAAFCDPRHSHGSIAPCGVRVCTRLGPAVRDVRRDLGIPNLLVIQVGIATGQGKFVDLIRKAQWAVRAPDLRCVDVFMDLGRQTNQARGQTGEVPGTRSRPFGEFDDLTFIKVSKIKIQGHKRIGLFASNPTSPRTSKSKFV